MDVSNILLERRVQLFYTSILIYPFVRGIKRGWVKIENTEFPPFHSFANSPREWSTIEICSLI